MSAALQRDDPPEPAAESLLTLLPLLREVGDLKRIRSAGRDGSIATRLFRAAWAGLCAGSAVRDVALAITGAALAAARLGDLDRPTLAGLGLSEEESLAVREAALEEVAGPVPERLRRELRAGLRFPALEAVASNLPPFVGALEAQPRAGVTCPGRARIVLQPAENHAEHCLAVAVYGVLLSDEYGADISTVFLAGLAHHLHNAAMPDAGFTGEILLGRHLDTVVRAATERALAELDAALREKVGRARAVLPDAASPAGRAFHAADVLDRVLEIEQHLTGAGLTMATVQGEMALVHDGPVKPFHDAVLSRFGLA